MSGSEVWWLVEMWLHLVIVVSVNLSALSKVVIRRRI